MRVALVTGANKGIGKEIARRIGADSTDWRVLLGCRSTVLGEEAAAELREGGCDCEVLHVDLDDLDSIAAAAKSVEDTYGRLDALVNNAAICFNSPTLYGMVEHTPFEKQASITVRTNFFGTLAVTQAFLPLLQQRGRGLASASSPSTPPSACSVARVVNIASSAGRLSILRSAEKASKLTDPALQLETLQATMQQFVEDVEGGRHVEEGWPNTVYGMSKIGIIALTKILARDHGESQSNDGDGSEGRRPIMVNSVDPGYCATDQNNNQGIQSAAVGAQVPAALVLLEDNGKPGGGGGGGSSDDAPSFITSKHINYDGREIDWYSS